MEIKRGDIYYADLRPVTGSEQGGVRPVLIIQNDKGNQYSPTVIAAAITGRKKRWMPTHVRLYRQAGLNRNCCIMLEQVRTIDRTRLVRYIGRLDDRTMQAVDTALAVSLGIAPDGWQAPRKKKGNGRMRGRQEDEGQNDSACVPDAITARMIQEVDHAIAASFGLEEIISGASESEENSSDGKG